MHLCSTMAFAQWESETLVQDSRQCICPCGLLGGMSRGRHFARLCPSLMTASPLEGASDVSTKTGTLEPFTYL